MQKNGRQCNLFSNSDRNAVFGEFNNLGNLYLQREYIVRHTDSLETKQKTTRENVSRRQRSLNYHLTLNSNRILVCKTFFLHTLGVSEKICRTAILKTN